MSDFYKNILEFQDKRVSKLCVTFGITKGYLDMLMSQDKISKKDVEVLINRMEKLWGQIQDSKLDKIQMELL
jgi:hypothetical protein